MLAKEEVEYVVLLPDWRIADLPLEGMKIFQALKVEKSSARILYWPRLLDSHDRSST